jgi:hypothetical protein
MQPAVSSPAQEAGEGLICACCLASTCRPMYGLMPVPWAAPYQQIRCSCTLPPSSCGSVGLNLCVPWPPVLQLQEVIEGLLKAQNEAKGADSPQGRGRGSPGGSAGQVTPNTRKRGGSHLRPVSYLTCSIGKAYCLPSYCCLAIHLGRTLQAYPRHTLCSLQCFMGSQ